MKRLNFVTLLLLISIFNGCAENKLKIADNSSNNSVKIDQTVNDDEFLDEFEEEMEIKEVYDPLFQYNKFMTSVNDNLYVYILRPVSNGYKAVVHIEIRNSVNNFFHNILYPIRLVNNVLQGKFSNSFEETQRFALNTTVGLFGFFDPANVYYNLEKHDEDFGQTLGHYGVGSGFHIVLPIFGSSNLRDVVSIYPDSYLNPAIYIDERSWNLVQNRTDSILLKAYKTINYTSTNGKQYDDLRKDAVELYPFLRDIYEQYRDNQIKE